MWNDLAPKQGEYTFMVKSLLTARFVKREIMSRLVGAVTMRLPCSSRGSVRCSPYWRLPELGGVDVLSFAYLWRWLEVRYRRMDFEELCFARPTWVGENLFGMASLV